MPCRNRNMWFEKQRSTLRLPNLAYSHEFDKFSWTELQKFSWFSKGRYSRTYKSAAGNQFLTVQKVDDENRATKRSRQVLC